MIAKEKLPKHLLQVMYLTFGVQGRASPHHGAQRLLDSRLSGGLTPNSCQERISSGLGVLRTTLPQDISSLFSGHPPLLVSQSRRCVPSTLDSRGSRVVGQGWTPAGVWCHLASGSVPKHSRPLLWPCFAKPALLCAVPGRAMAGAGFWPDFIPN